MLFLTADPAQVAAQLSGDGAPDPSTLVGADLLDSISTDEIIPGWCCYWYDGKLGDYAYLGLRNKLFGEGTLRSFGAQILVSGEAKGCGSSREHAVYAEKYAGVELVFARSFERIYQANCRNVGILTCDDFELLEALLAGERLPLRAFTGQATAIDRAIIDLGGLFGFNRTPSSVDTAFGPARPLNIVEKIIQSRLAERNRLPDRAAIRVGESYFVTADVRFSHEYVTPMAAGMFERQFGTGAVLDDPGSCYFFQDHLSLAPSVLSRRGDGPALIDRVAGLNARQAQFAATHGGHFIGPAPDGGSRAICHNYIVERVARPGQVIIGTDSHTCTSGAVGAFAFGVGTTDIANAWYNRQILVKVPPVVRIDLTGRLPAGVCAKDLMLALLVHPELPAAATRGSVLLFAGPGCAELNLDERATLCNMAVEAGAMTGLFEPDTVTAAFLATRGDDPPTMVRSDGDATFARTVHIALSDVEAMVALPGDPRNSVPLRSISGPIAIDKAYGGSCTGGKATDLDMYASVFELARSKGRRVADGVEVYLQLGSEAVGRHARERGYLELFADVGVTVLPPSCGACINAGPGVSEQDSEVTVSAQNRNFPGRSGPGQVYLASPYVVAASAVAGRLSSVADMLDGAGP